MRFIVAIGVATAFAALLLTECSNVPGDPGFAGHPVDCALGIYHADCAADSVASKQAVAVNDSDDAQCRAYGLQWGTPGYAQCRQNINAQRSANALAAISVLQANRPAPLPMPAPPPRTYNTSCQTYGPTTNCQTQ